MINQRRIWSSTTCTWSRTLRFAPQSRSFVASMPSWLRLIIMTRADPPLPSPRLRAEGRLAEIRQRDLRFDSSEAATLLRAEGIDNLADDQLQWLTDRTEGWAAGLQLAAIVLGDNPGPDRLSQIAGSNRTFADYIVSEVVDVASDDMRRFLFTTSVLDRVSPSLASSGVRPRRCRADAARRTAARLVHRRPRRAWRVVPLSRVVRRGDPGRGAIASTENGAARPRGRGEVVRGPTRTS